MFSSGMTESSSSEIFMENSFFPLYKTIQYMYSDDITCDEENVVEMLLLANQYGKNFLMISQKIEKISRLSSFEKYV